MGPAVSPKERLKCSHQNYRVLRGQEEEEIAANETEKVGKQPRVRSFESPGKQETVFFVSNTDKSCNEMQYENSTLDLVRWIVFPFSLLP